MSSEPQWRDVIDLLIPHPTQRQLLVQQVDGQWQLPRAAIDQLWDGPIGRINTAVQRDYGLETTVVRRLAEIQDGAHHLVFHLYLQENHTAGWATSENLQWLDLTALDQVALAHPDHRQALARYCQEIEEGVIPAPPRPDARFGNNRVGCARQPPGSRRN